MLYPFTKDASDPAHAKQLAASYFDYVEEKKEQAAEMKENKEEGEEQVGGWWLV